jgi:hypothetical protein
MIPGVAGLPSRLKPPEQTRNASCAQVAPPSRLRSRVNVACCVGCVKSAEAITSSAEIAPSGQVNAGLTNGDWLARQVRDATSVAVCCVAIGYPLVERHGRGGDGVGALRPEDLGHDLLEQAGADRGDIDG